MAFYVYMLASGRNGTLYVGQTDDLIARVHQHCEKALKGFTAKYGVDRLVWFEVCTDRDSALTYERRIKKWYRAWKLRTIEAANPEWRDLYEDLLDPGRPLHPDLSVSASPAHAGAQTSALGQQAAGVANLGPRMRGEDGQR